LPADVPPVRAKRQTVQARSSATTGTPSAIQVKNGTSKPTSRRMKPMPIRFGGVPTGVPSPPIDAPNDVESSSALPYAGGTEPRSPNDSSEWRSDTPIGNIIAVVAVLLIHIEIAACRDRIGREDRARAARRCREAKDREREAPVEPVEVDRLRDHERPDEHEDQRIGERRERLAAGRDAEEHRRGRRRGTPSSPSGSPR
jgi:hypothetical protein